MLSICYVCFLLLTGTNHIPLAVYSSLISLKLNSCWENESKVVSLFQAYACSAVNGFQNAYVIYEHTNWTIPIFVQGPTKFIIFIPLLWHTHFQSILSVRCYCYCYCCCAQVKREQFFYSNCWALSTIKFVMRDILNRKYICQHLYDALWNMK